MADDGMSASELRAQYARGGSLDDSQLTASQLRARHGIQANTKGQAESTMAATWKRLTAATVQQARGAWCTIVCICNMLTLGFFRRTLCALCAEFSTRTNGSSSGVNTVLIGAAAAVLIIVLIGYLLVGSNSEKGHEEL